MTRSLTGDYDAIVNAYDLLLMPTRPIKASKLPDNASSMEERASRSGDMLANTMPFNPPHHPAMNVPCGMSDGLPVGMILVGRCHAEPIISVVAKIFSEISFSPLHLKGNNGFFDGYRTSPLVSFAPPP